MESTTNRTFTCFLLFPPEIRDLIWEACLPHRVVDIDPPTSVGYDQLATSGRVSILIKWSVPDAKYSQWSEVIPDELEDEPFCTWSSQDSKQWRASVSCPPVISRVCRESRAVALRNGGSIDRSWKIPRWLDPARDVLHLNWNQWIPDDFNFPYLPGTVADVVGSEARRVSITYNLANVSYIEEEDRDVTIPDQLAARSSYELCLGTVIIHVTGSKQEQREKIIDSSLFDLFGQKRTELVAATDHARLRRFADFNAVHGSPQDIRASYFFDNYQTEDVQTHLRQVDLMWLKYRWDEAEKKGTDIEDSELVWGVLPDLDYRVVDFEAPNLEHPWVRGVLYAMPRLVPAYIIRLCVDGCT